MRRLRRSKGDRALVEGPHLVHEAIEAGLPLEDVMATPEFLASEVGRRLASRLSTPPLPVEPNLLAEEADTDTPRGIVATTVLHRPGTEGLSPLAADATVVYLDGVQDPHNVGAIARVAEAAGVSALVAGPGTAHPNHPRALRASAGSLLRMRVSREVTAGALAQTWPDAHWVALDGAATTDLWTWSPEPPVVIVLGSEGSGLSEAVRTLEPRLIAVPMAGRVESLNVGVAAGVVLYELARRRGLP